MKTAVLIDGAFFIHRAKRIYGKLEPEELVNKMLGGCIKHLPAPAPFERQSEDSDGRVDGWMVDRYLYRIFFYDCPPSEKRFEHPLTKTMIDLKRSDRSAWRRRLHDVLRRTRKVALRLGSVDDATPSWSISSSMIKQLCRGAIAFSDLTEDDITIDFRQKGVDMRIGLDIASLAYKKQVDRIVLISGDSDFVPAAKLARREGVEFVLDPMWQSIRPELEEHIDRLHSTFPKQTRSTCDLTTND